MLNWTDFEAVFRSKAEFTLDQKQIDTITRHRKEFGGTLYFDRIWSSIGLRQSQKAYPPKTNAELRALWQKVVRTDVTDEKKQAVLFYILHDCKQPSNIDAIFARKTYLPLKYQVLVSGLWELDHGQFSRALEHLTDPTLSSEFADDILLTLLSSSKCDQSLAIAYYLTVSPALHEEKTRRAYFNLLLQTNVVEAYHFAQRRGGMLHRYLFELMLHATHGEEPSTAKAQRMTIMMSLPLSKEEEDWFEEYLLRGDGSQLPGSKDSVIMRRLATGRSLEGAGSLDRYRGIRIDGTDWDDIRTMQKSAIPKLDSI